ncbi:hypothetical protein MKW92_036886, partial [Papaver armeniacum]
GLSLVRRAGDLHYEALAKREKVHQLTMQNFQRENDQLKRQIKDLHARNHGANNALGLMRKQ